MRTIGFLPLRGGSESIPLKNIKKLNGKPLAYYVLDAMTQCELIDFIIVATDSIEIAQVITEYDSHKIIIMGRSEEVSTNIATTESVMLEVLADVDFDDVVLVQATSPLLTTRDLEKGIKLKEQYDSVLSVVREHRFIWDEQTRTPLNYDYMDRPRRQDWQGNLIENGAFYITSKTALFKTKCRISGDIGLSEMSLDTYIEIDEEHDWVFVEHLLNQKNEGDNEGDKDI